MSDILPKKGDIIQVKPNKIENNVIELNLLDEKYSGKKALLPCSCINDEEDLNLKLVNYNFDNLNDDKFIVKVLFIKKIGKDIHVNVTCIAINKKKNKQLKKERKQKLKRDNIDILFRDEETDNEKEKDNSVEDDEDGTVYLSRDQKIDGLNSLFDDFIEDINEKISNKQLVKNIEFNNWINVQFSCLKIQVNLENSEISSISVNRLLNKYSDQNKISELIDVLKNAFNQQISSIDSQIEFIEKLDYNLKDSEVKVNILFILYNKDILDEEAILKWFDKKNNKYALLNNKTIGFINWLKTAESDSEDSS